MKEHLLFSLKNPLVRMTLGAVIGASSLLIIPEKAHAIEPGARMSESAEHNPLPIQTVRTRVIDKQNSFIVSADAAVRRILLDASRSGK